ncbi:hypothetical protein K435DRAFT_800388 [Dendrothele bispora CBS 962.96]|uniref:Uncharacterized protein n=1 Tax=Dendrothele bispora (strain CBS 962.96) TaxID=1314807 RepID=A0A4S8LT86_DENBC|nr:hypothetical protein K435DRAFT_800388 [Dendrothele bispora CBS 962.96]
MKKDLDPTRTRMVGGYRFFDGLQTPFVSSSSGPICTGSGFLDPYSYSQPAAVTTHQTCAFHYSDVFASFSVAFIAIYGSKYQILLQDGFFAQCSGISAIKSFLYLSVNIIADIVLIHRCYKIWGANKKIIVLPMFISIINNVLGGGLGSYRIEILGEYASRSFVTVNFLANLAIPSLIAGRIWWIGYQVSKSLPTRKFNLTRHIMAVCLESGIMHPLALIPALVIIFSPPNSLSSNIDFIPILIQVVGIAPTFIIDTIHMNEQNGHEDQTVLSMWEANHNIDEYAQK